MFEAFQAPLISCSRSTGLWYSYMAAFGIGTKAADMQPRQGQMQIFGGKSCKGMSTGTPATQQRFKLLAGA
jgi:hypothetical protein